MIKVLAFSLLIHQSWLVAGMQESNQNQIKAHKNIDGESITASPTTKLMKLEDNNIFLDEKLVTSSVFRGGSPLSRLIFDNNHYSFQSRFQGQGCLRNPCGSNAICQETLGGRPVCSCPPGYSGNPLSYCRRGECSDSIECRLDQACQNGQCINPCAGKCGINANCEVKNHVAVCSCPARYKGDPFHHCRQMDPYELCNPSPCGINTKCEVVGDQPTCSCLPSYKGNPLTGCRHECDSDYDCGPQETCSNFKCIRACSQCGKGATCVTVANHRATCECPKGYIGSPYTECRPECYGDSDCPGSRPACFYGICKNPCDGACGVNADCNLRGLTPICSCPRDMTGDPFISCRKFVPEDLCRPNPCGTNAICTPGYDRTQRERPVCTCPPGYTGNALTNCVRGECQSDSECADHRACINYQCIDACHGNKCGLNAMCTAKRHLAVCECPPGYTGDGLASCRQSKTYPIARYNRSLEKQLASNETITHSAPESEVTSVEPTTVESTTAEVKKVESTTAEATTLKA